MTVETMPKAGSSAPAPYTYAEQPGLPYLGTMLSFVHDPIAYEVGLRKTADMVATNGFGRRFYAISHPGLIEDVLVTKNAHFRKAAGLRSLTGIFGNGLLTSDGDFWLRQRRLASPAFHRQRIAAYADQMVQFTHRMLDGWRHGGVLDLHQEMMHLTLNVVARCLFGTDTSAEAARIGHALDAVMSLLNNQGLIKLAQSMLRIRTREHRAFDAGIKMLDEVVYGIIHVRKNSDDDRGDLLSMFLAARDEDGSRMSDQQLHDECLTMLIAGHETTALALSWAWYELTQKPEVAALMRAELAQVLGDRAPAVADLSALPYTSQVITETMRLHPPAWNISREALTDVEIGGHTIPAGTEILMSQYAVHRHPDYYDNPDAFKPERWSGDLAKTLPKYAYFPFGGGPRLCIGQQFAQMEAILILATMAQRFDLDLVPGQRIVPQPSITLRPKYGLKVKLRSPRIG